MTIKQAKATARALGFKLTHEDGEFRVCPIGGHEGQAYYTDDLDDAIGTARWMSERA